MAKRLESIVMLLTQGKGTLGWNWRTPSALDTDLG
jgi:hypothetical protein